MTSKLQGGKGEEMTKLSSISDAANNSLFSSREEDLLSHPCQTISGDNHEKLFPSSTISRVTIRKFSGDPNFPSLFNLKTFLLSPLSIAKWTKKTFVPRPGG